MKLIRKAAAVWKGNLKNEEGKLNTETGALKNKKYSFSSRFEKGEGTNPEELTAAAHAGCFSMALSSDLEKDGYEANSIETEDHVHLEKGAEGFSYPGRWLELNLCWKRF
jgi:osmotically inducible protein OsmC